MNRFFFFKEAITEHCFAQCDFSGCVCVVCVYMCFRDIVWQLFGKNVNSRYINHSCRRNFFFFLNTVRLFVLWVPILFHCAASFGPSNYFTFLMVLTFYPNYFCLNQHSNADFEFRNKFTSSRSGYPFSLYLVYSNATKLK